MIDSISSWAGQIVIAVVVVTILEMILPNGNNKKYIKTIIGIYILFVIVYPVVTYLSSGNLNFDTILASYSIENEVKEEENELSIKTSNQVKRLYAKELETKIKEDIETQGYNVENIELRVNLNSNEEYCEIVSLRILISKTNRVNNVVENRVIEPIDIKISTNKVEDVNKIISESEIETIKKVLIENYGIDKKNIIIEEE